MSSVEPVRTVVVTGATGLVGRHLLPLLLKRVPCVRAISRRPPSAASRAREGAEALDTRGSPGAQARGTNDSGGPIAPTDPEAVVTWHRLDLAETPMANLSPRLEALGPCSVLIHTAPLWLLPALLPAFADLGGRRLVAFGSTSRSTKARSRDSTEREAALRLVKAEAAIGEACRSRGIRWTLLRPTLIYGGGHDRNVSDVARWIERVGFFPIAGKGRGLRQPVHAEDLAIACLSVLENEATFDRVYDLPGGETLPYDQMVARVARGVGRRFRLVRLPSPVMRAIINAARLLPLYGHLTPDMADRMDEDLVFDAGPARRDFGYDPRKFGFPDGPSDYGGGC